MYVIGSHNSWSYLKPKSFWMRPFAFMAKCQRQDIKYQYLFFGVRCFDLRVKFDKDGKLSVAHGSMVYDIDKEGLLKDLQFINNRTITCYVRVLHEVRNKRAYNEKSINYFKEFCNEIVEAYPNIKFWCGRNLYNWSIDYEFSEHPTCEEKYSSVCPPKIIDDWFPFIYAKLNNSKIKNKGTDKDILLIDYVDIGQK